VVGLDQLTGFDWDAGNLEKNLKEHHVSPGECEEIFFNLPLLLKDDVIHSQTEPRYLVLGQTNTGSFC
jgi:uncharacterized protein